MAEMCPKCGYTEVETYECPHHRASLSMCRENLEVSSKVLLALSSEAERLDRMKAKAKGDRVGMGLQAARHAPLAQNGG